MTLEGDRLSAAVLAGGKSRRMGEDKALLPLVEGGKPMVAIVLDRLRELADDVAIVANDRERYEAFGARIVPDSMPGIGALGGIHAALMGAKNDHCLVVACDMPFLNRQLLRLMKLEPRDYDVLVPSIPGESRQRGDGFVYQTLHAIYGKGCLPAIETQIARGNRQVIGFFAEVRLRTVEFANVQRCDPELLTFFNANTPEALAKARSMAQGMELSSG
jgi:molybdopterin-guanine dinucleotide biosynthesis protein A